MLLHYLLSITEKHVWQPELFTRAFSKPHLTVPKIRYKRDSNFTRSYKGESFANLVTFWQVQTWVSNKTQKYATKKWRKCLQFQKLPKDTKQALKKQHPNGELQRPVGTAPAKQADVLHTQASNSSKFLMYIRHSQWSFCTLFPWYHAFFRCRHLWYNPSSHSLRRFGDSEAVRKCRKILNSFPTKKTIIQLP